MYYYYYYYYYYYHHHHQYYYYYYYCGNVTVFVGTCTKICSDEFPHHG
jgi:hypothetical protein